MLWCNQPIVDIYLYMLPLHDWCLSFCLQYASDNSKYHPHPHLGFHMTQRMMYLMMGCLCFGVLLILINIYQLRSINAGLAVGDPEFGSSSRPIVWINGKNVRNLTSHGLCSVFSSVELREALHLLNKLIAWKIIIVFFFLYLQ